MINRQTAIPLYHQIYLQLRDEILSGERPNGSALPTEQELAELYEVSRITARRVLTDLAKQKLVERRRRLGTRVTYKASARQIEANVDQAVDSLLEFGRKTVVAVVDVGREVASDPVARALGLPRGAEVMRAVRVRSMAGTPVGYIVSYVPIALADLISPALLAKSPILTLLEQAGYRPEKAEQTIGALEADTVISQALDIEARAALLRITRISYGRDDKPFLLTYAHYRADKFTIKLAMHQTGTAMLPTLDGGKKADEDS